MIDKNKSSVLFLRAFTKEIIHSTSLQLEKSLPKTELFILKSAQEKKLADKDFKEFISRKPLPPAKEAQQKKIQGAVPQQMPIRAPAQNPPRMLDETLVDFKKLFPIINNPQVNFIECPGPNKPIISKAYGRAEVTSLQLNEEEIKQIINEFSRVTKIPVLEGVFRAVWRNYMITAVISEIAGSRFIITRFMHQTPQQSGQARI